MKRARSVGGHGRSRKQPESKRMGHASHLTMRSSWAHKRRTTRARKVSGATIWRRSDMARRSKEWNVGLAEDLRDQAFAREFLPASIEEGVPLCRCGWVPPGS